MKYNYSVFIAWSREDEAYLAAVDELPGCMADGATPEEALANARKAAEIWLEVAREENRSIPQPMCVEDREEAGRRFRESLNQHIEKAVGNAVQKAVSAVISQLRKEESEYFCGFKRLPPRSELRSGGAEHLFGGGPKKR